MVIQFAIDYGMYLPTLAMQRLLAALKIDYGQSDMTEAYKEGSQVMKYIE
jgi:hypothetical protein